jgi:ubiquitin carboxyl-terminal hydrolase 34
MLRFSLARVSTTNFVVAFWPTIGKLISEAVRQPQQCEETFSLALTLFKRLAETSLELFDLDDLIKQWGVILLAHSCVEVCHLKPKYPSYLIVIKKPGHVESIDLIAHGLANLILCAASFAKASKKLLSCR